ncbi:putative LRR receptor-like serine/threonine-protein kinase [Apostasia shenzhenica]|uniref:Putative LRR receptor-like serine/threonine-protein kinase n=1 Tax=Apostasia shenzhenica TaxID=1088818 RepID=A0A2I0B6I3_9ASPA|nr:putative LRR receptor-like serine/threonine-protein kinase [Apostasia shenzhenica]
MGSIGSVYKGNLNGKPHDVIVVKVLNLHRHGALRSFKVLGCIHHQNLVKLLTSCLSINYEGNDFKAAIDVACALDYLHNHGLSPVIHCDLKPSNVLDIDMVAYVGDLGLAKLPVKLLQLSPLKLQQILLH